MAPTLGSIRPTHRPSPPTRRLAAKPAPMNTVTVPRWKQALLSVFHSSSVKARREAELAETMREVCHALIGDLETGRRIALGMRIDQAGERSDVWELRACLFDAISMQHGEQVARERLAELDSRWP
jgi:hypothetical protein